MDLGEETRCPACFRLLESGEQCHEPACIEDAADRSLNDLPLGTILNEQFCVGRVLGRGGFGITYLAWDERLHHRRAIKECFPQGLVRRARDGLTILPTNERTRKQFDTVRELFLKEARVLAHFHDQPGIVSALSILDTNGTAYLVMEYLSGQTLKDYLEAQPDSRVDVNHALALLNPVIEALTAVHEQNWLHRDISPDNIFVTRRGDVKLLDFGAARYVAGQQTKSIPVILKEGYAPAEQYSLKGQQGTWTDVYALAATFYRAITGVTPPPALDRLEDDELVLPSDGGIEIDPSAEAALLAALAIRGQQRTRTIPEFAVALNRHVVETESGPNAEPDSEPETRLPPRTNPESESGPSSGEQQEPEPDSLSQSLPQGDAPRAPWPVAPQPEAIEVPGPGGARWYLVAVAFALVLVLVYLFHWGPESPGTDVPPVESGVLVIDASPWAIIERVVDQSGKEQALPDSATPLWLTLPAGEYRIHLRGPSNERREVQVAVVPGPAQPIPPVTFGGVALDQYFREQLQVAAPGASR